MRRFLILLAAAAFCFADDAPGAVSAAAPAADGAVAAAEPDSVAIYRKLIREEAAGADFGANFVGMAFSGLFLGAGTGFAISSNVAAVYENQARLGNYAAGSALVGVPLFVFNLVSYQSHKRHADARDAWQDALERRLARLADENRSESEEEAEDEAEVAELYARLIAREANEARYGAKFALIAVSGAFVGAGVAFLASVHYTHDPDAFLDLGPVIPLLLGVGALTTGVPLMIYGVCSYRSASRHDAKREAHREELERRLERRAGERRSAAKIMVVPAVDVVRVGAGANLVVAF